MKVMGVDPGLANTGVALVSGSPERIESFEFQSIRTSENDPASLRLFAIFQAVTDLISKNGPALVVVEAVFSSGDHPKSAIFLGMASGAVLAACGGCAVPAMEVAARDVKRTLTGNGAANKEQLERAVRGFLNRSLPIRPSHASDALAMALIGLYRADTILAGL